MPEMRCPEQNHALRGEIAMVAATDRLFPVAVAVLAITPPLAISGGVLEQKSLLGLALLFFAMSVGAYIVRLVALVVVGSFGGVEVVNKNKHPVAVVSSSFFLLSFITGLVALSVWSVRVI